MDGAEITIWYVGDAAFIYQYCNCLLFQHLCIQSIFESDGQLLVCKSSFPCGQVFHSTFLAKTSYIAIFLFME